jgi:hypothetical protein
VVTTKWRNQFSYPDAPFDEKVLLRLPGDMLDDMTSAAEAEGITRAEWMRRAFADDLRRRADGAE